MIKLHNLNKTVFFTLSFLSLVALSSCSKSEDLTVKVGILHSQTGSMAISEIPVSQAELLAIDEINNAGGVLGHQIVPVVRDGQSNPKIFSDMATKLIEDDGVATIFGCWTSDSRKAVRNVVESHYNLLWYPLQYEGMEASPNIMYIGAAPNQQIVPAIDYCAEHFGKKMYLVGSDYVFPQTANRIIRAQLKDMGGKIVGEEYVPLGSDSFDSIIEDILKTKPDVIINTLNGDSNIAFFAQLKTAGITSEKIPVMSFSISESEIAGIDAANCAGNYVAWPYFESIANVQNRNLIENFRKNYGKTDRIGAPIEAGYIAVYLWAAACEKAGSFDVEEIRIASKGMSYVSPEGMITIEGSNQHLNTKARIGIILSNGTIKEIWSTETVVRPDPYLSTYAWARGL